MQDGSAVCFFTKPPKRMAGSLVGTVVMRGLDGLHNCKCVLISFSACERIQQFDISSEAPMGLLYGNGFISILNNIADSNEFIFPVFKCFRHLWNA